MEKFTNTQYFSKFKSAITSYVPGGHNESLLMDNDGKIKVYYAPFEYMNPKAKIIIVGITPGPTQMNNAIAEARRQLRSGNSDIETLREAKQFGAFSGDVFRKNLVAQLNHWGVDRYLGVESAASLFNENAYLIQTTSLLRYPVFVDGKKYEGNPDMVRTPILRKHLLEHFVGEVCSMKDALFMGLGPKVWSVLSKLSDEGVINRSRVFNGVLHASGENTYRINYMVGDRTAAVPWKTNPAAYDSGRGQFRSQFGL